MRSYKVYLMLEDESNDISEEIYSRELDVESEFPSNRLIDDIGESLKQLEMNYYAE